MKDSSDLHIAFILKKENGAWDFLLALGYGLITGSIPWNVSLLSNKDYLYSNIVPLK